jgi:bifunctional non-homologous end joining protein LigD
MTLPRIQPIIPTLRKEPFDDPGWLFDIKYDGFRALCYLERGCCRLVSRNGNNFRRFDALAAEVAAALRVDEAILDGEVIVADETGRPQFYDLARAAAGGLADDRRGPVGRGSRVRAVRFDGRARSRRHCRQAAG